MDPLTPTAIDPDHARKIAAILLIRPDDSAPLAQFSTEQREACEWAIAWLHDFNLGRRPRPSFSDEVLGRLTDFHGTQMNEHFRQTGPAAAPAPTPASNQAEAMLSDDPLAEWTQRMLAGMKRMTEDPEYRASIEKRIS